MVWNNCLWLQFLSVDLAHFLKQKWRSPNNKNKYPHHLAIVNRTSLLQMSLSQVFFSGHLCKWLCTHGLQLACWAHFPNKYILLISNVCALENLSAWFLCLSHKCKIVCSIAKAYDTINTSKCGSLGPALLIESPLHMLLLIGHPAGRGGRRGCSGCSWRTKAIEGKLQFTSQHKESSGG